MRKSAFTLIELLIVLIIITVLAGAMVPLFRTNRVQAQQARVRSDLDALKTAAIMYHHDTGAWPPTGTNGADFVTDAAPATPGWNGPYLDEWKPSPWPNPAGGFYPYEIYDSALPPPIIRRVRSLGADNAVGGTGANEDIIVVITPNTAM